MSEDNKSLGAKVYRQIRDNILSGKYAVNEELKEKNIGEELGVSRTPVREALRQLELEGLVSIISNKGAYVVGVTLDDIKDIYEMRILLEGLCAKKAANNITPELIELLDENICLSEFYVQNNNLDKMVNLDSEFHKILYEASKSKELNKVLKDYHEYVARVRKETLTDLNRCKASLLEHKQIAEAIKNHDCELAEKYARLHISNTMENMDKIGWENLVK